MKAAYSLGVAGNNRNKIFHIGNVWVGIGIADFSNSVPRFAYMGRIAKPAGRPGRSWIFRIWNFAIQVDKLEAAE